MCWLSFCVRLLGHLSPCSVLPTYLIPIHKLYPALKTTEISKGASPILREARLSGGCGLLSCAYMCSQTSLQTRQSLEHKGEWPLPPPPPSSFSSFLFNSLSISIWSLWSREEQPHVWILAADWFLESWCEDTSNMPGGGECDLASLYNPLQLSHRMSLFLKSTYYLTIADAIRQKYRVLGMQFIKTGFGASWKDTGWKC